MAHDPIKRDPISRGKRLRVAVLMGGPSPERDVSLASGLQVLQAADPQQYEILPYEITREGKWLPRPDLLLLAAPGSAPQVGAVPEVAPSTALVPHRIEEAVGDGAVDVAFIALHGPYGEDGTIQGLLELLGIPYTGSGVLASALEMGEVVLVEAYLRGTELTCAILEDPKTGLPTPLPVIEIVPKREFFNYQAKYEAGASEEIVPARIPAAVTQKAQQMALRAHRALGCEGMSRVDMFAHEGEIMLLEVNTIPGLTPGSLLPKAAAAAGIDFPELVNRIIQGALRRERRRRGRERKPV